MRLLVSIMVIMFIVGCVVHFSKEPPSCEGGIIVEGMTVRGTSVKTLVCLTKEDI